MMDARRRGLVVLGIVFALGTGLRINNALRYPIDMGFDAIGNWEYIALLLRSWTLPAPDVGWSTAHPPFFYNFAAVVIKSFGLGSKAARARAAVAGGPSGG